jgi:Endosomal/lysosomal potassium channel TMEM175
MREYETSRIEGFSDAAFGFALTLLVVSLEVPETFADLKRTLVGFLPFAVTFALVCWIWYLHYAFFRRFGLRDGLTVFLNCLLLFVVLFFVYPLKFVFGNIIPVWTGIGVREHAGFEGMTAADGRFLMVAYSAGVIAVFGVFTLFYWNARRQKGRLGLTELDLFDAASGMRAHGFSVGLGVASVLLAITLPIERLWISGMIYALEGPIQGVNGYLTGKARARRAPSSTPTPP